jgi:hypothetical protein
MYGTHLPRFVARARKSRRIEATCAKVEKAMWKERQRCRRPREARRGCEAAQGIMMHMPVDAQDHVYCNGKQDRERSVTLARGMLALTGVTLRYGRHSP